MYRLVTKHKLSEVNVFLSTEDPVALNSFQQYKPSHWNVYVYEAAVSSEKQVHEVRTDAVKDKGYCLNHINPVV